MTQSKRLARLMGAAVAALIAVALLAPAAQADPTEPGYEQFSGCPTHAQSPTSALCIRAEVTGGHLQMGKEDVPIEKTLTLSGGVNEFFENFTAGPEGGLSPVKLEVPGGVIGLTGLNWLIKFLNVEALKLYAVTELTAPPTNITGVTVTLPIRAHLINVALGNNCYIGTKANPITLNLRTGSTHPLPPNEEITGVEPTFTEDASKGIVYAKDGTFVDNEFAAPGASGCVLTLLGFIPISLDGIVNFQSGLPSPAGTNEAVQEIDLEFTSQELVY